MTAPVTATGWPRRLLFAAGFALVALGAGLWLGGAFALGRRDATLALPTLLAFALVFAALQPGAVAAALGAAVLIVVAAVSGALAPAPVLFAGGAGLAMLAAHCGVRWTAALARPFAAALLAVAAVLWWVGSHAVLARTAMGDVTPQTGRIVVVSGLLLAVWDADNAIKGAREDPALTMLRAAVARPVQLADSLSGGALKPADRLLLVHPRALAPEALVEIDRFVRAGGRAVILADGLSAWPPPFAMGDARNPPVTSLLTPLLDHWGIGLAAPVPGSAAGEEVAVQHGRFRLRLHSAGHFDRLPPQCRGEAAIAPQQPAVATCRIGKGEAVLLADADLLYAPLWQSAPGWARHLRPSDNIEWLAELLNR